MTHYINVKMRIRSSKRQAYESIESNSKSITIRLTFSDMHGEKKITNSQLDRLVKAYEEKKGMTIRV